MLLAYLRARNGPWGNFMVTNGLAETLGWTRKRMADARRRLIELGHLHSVRQAGRGNPALFRWRGTVSAKRVVKFVHLSLLTTLHSPLSPLPTPVAQPPGLQLPHVRCV